MKKYYVLCLALLLCVATWAINAEDYLIGAYSQYQIRYTGANYAAKFDSLAMYLKNAGYNATTYGSPSNSLEAGDKLPTILNKMHLSNISSMYYDTCWEPEIGDGLIGVGTLSYGNQLIIEAEYELKSVDGNFVVDSLRTGSEADENCLESLDYVAKHHNGRPISNEPNRLFSNNYAWVCDVAEGDSAGYAMSFPRKRWKRSYDSWPALLSKDLVFMNRAIEENELYISVALQHDNVPMGEDIASVYLKVYELLSHLSNQETLYQMSEDELLANGRYVLLPLIPCFQTSDGNKIKNISYSGVERDTYGNDVFVFRADMSNLTSYMDGSSYSYARSFYHINPEIYWHGNGKLMIDYIKIEDMYGRSIDSDPESIYLSKLRNSVNALKNMDTNNNLLYLMSMDEPRAGQMAAYKNIQNYLDSEEPGVKMITTSNLRDWDLSKEAYDIANTIYNHPKRFLYETRPNRVLVDIYPLQGTVEWNNGTSRRSAQRRIDKMVHYFYCRLAKDVEAYNLTNTELYHVPQTFGILKKHGGWSYNFPPRNMIKVLKYLPLCYASDGTIDFCIASNPHDVVEEGNWVTPLIHDSSGSYNRYNNLRVTDNLSAYEKISEANQKIAVYGPIIKGLKWLTANKIMEQGIELMPELNNGDLIVLNSVLLNNVVVEADPGETRYTGYVQCGYYEDNDNPYFMLVNRRAVSRKTGNDILGENTPLSEVDSFFKDALPQIVCFEPNNGSHNVFGTHLALYDPYDSGLYRTVSDTIRVEIGPGDGKLLEMCSTLPHEVAANSTLSNKAVLEGTINILPGVNVVTNSGTETKILDNSVINVGDGASYTLRGDVTIGDGVSIVVSQNGSLDIDNANCIWGTGSFIQVNGGTLSIDGGSMKKSVTATKWGGIRVTDSNSVLITNATISGAHYHSVTNSNLEISDSKISFPENSLGLLLQNNTPGYSTEISASDAADKGFFGASNITSRGIGLGVMKNPVIINNVTFHNLKYGIEKTAYPHAANTITWCRFVNCGIGVRLNNNAYNTSIQRCTFSNNNTGKQGTGIRLTASLPTITGCSFNKLYRGIFTEMSLATGLTLGVKIKDSNFKECEAGIESRGSNHRLETNCFNRNDSGIINHAGSNLNLSDTANNIMKNKDYNIVFNDTAPYNSTIQLFTGHNDFYHLGNNATNATAIDFCFDSNYQGDPSTIYNSINASYNWFQDYQVTVNDPAYAGYVFVGTYDSEPSMPDPDYPPIGNRLYAALGHESQELYDLAATTYQAIIDDQLVAERSYVTSAIDGLYRCKEMTSSPRSETIDYFDAKAAQHAVENPSLSAILKDYLLKLHLLDKDFQSAVDLLQPRISDPVSEVDSLRAVLDLEIVLQLAAAEGSKRPVVTEYAQYQYPNFQVFEVMHDQNWEKYRQALQKNNPEMANIPAVPLISNNYPNPFNPSTTIAFSIPEDGLVKIDIYNIKGQKIKQLCDAEMQRGHHKVIWNGKDKNERSVSSGVYFVRLQANGQTAARKIMLMK